MRYQTTHFHALTGHNLTKVDLFENNLINLRPECDELFDCERFERVLLRRKIMCRDD